MERREGAQVLSEERKVEGESPPREVDHAPKGPGGGRTWLLVVSLVIVPGLLYAAVLGVPFLPLATGTKVWGSAGPILAAEGTFVVSAMLLGKEVVSRYRRSLDPRRWFHGR